MRRTYGRCDDSRHEQLRLGQPRHLRHQSCCSLRSREREHRGRDHTRADTQSSHRHIHQAEPRSAVGTMRLRSGKHRLFMWHNIPHGRKLRTDLFLSEEHDCQPYRHDMRRSKTVVLAENHIRSEHGTTIGTALYRGTPCLFG